MLSVTCYLKEEKYEKHFINKNLAGFVTCYFALCLTLVHLNTVKTYKRLRVRNTDPRFHLVSCDKKHSLVSNEKCRFL